MDQRQLKSRVWDSRSNCWMKEGEILFGMNGEIYLFIDKDERPFLTDKEYFIRQDFIGILDVNSHEIYEGDIVEFKHGFSYLQEPEIILGVIGFQTHPHGSQHHFAGFEIQFPEGGRHTKYYGWGGEAECPIDELRIVGNIFENENLLKEAKR